MAATGAVFLAARLAAVFLAAVFFAGGLVADAVTLAARRLVAAAGVPDVRASSCAAAASLTASSEAFSDGCGALTMVLLPWWWFFRAARRDWRRASSIEGASPSAIASVAVTDGRPTLASPFVSASA